MSRPSDRPASRESPALTSVRAPGAFVRDAAKGLAWLVRRTPGLLAGRAPLSRGASGIEKIDRPDEIGASAMGVAVNP